MPSKRLRVVLIKPSKYAPDGVVQRFRWGFMPNSTLAYIRSLTPHAMRNVPCDVLAFDEYVQTDLNYLSALHREAGVTTLLAVVGVQSHQFQRAIDLAAYAREHGVEHCVIGGPHPMTCDTSILQNRGVSFSLAEAESVWPAILEDACSGELAPVYGRDHRWHEVLEPPPLQPVSKKDLSRYVVHMMGIYPARGCPYTCNFCSVIKIAGRAVRSQPVDTTMASLRMAQTAGVRMVMFTSDNFNKYAQAPELLHRMVEEKIRLPFFAQCDAQIYKQPELIELLARAGCFQLFVGVESFSRDVLKAAQKFQNHPEHYREIVAMCRAVGITTHFSNMLGFPADTEASILHHLKVLKSLRPDVASFYVLTPIPGTEQYDEFLSAGLIREHNMDRFDGTTLTWNHPALSKYQLNELLKRCYREFFQTSDILSKFVAVSSKFWDFRMLPRLFTLSGYPIQSRVAVRQDLHPMSGGILPCVLDSAADYAAVREKVFGLHQVPLPSSLRLSEKDEQINRTAKLTELPSSLAL